MPYSSIPESKTKALIGIFLIVILFIVWTAINRLVLPLFIHQNAVSTIFFISRLTFWGYLLLLYLYARNVEREPFNPWPDTKYSFSYGMLSVFVILIIVYTFIGGFGVVANHIHLERASAKIKAIMHLTMPVKLLTVVTAAVVEELIFRGYLMPRLQLFFKQTYMPVITSALIFALGHITYGTLINVAGPLIIGLIFGYHYQRYRNLKILTVCHFIIDFTAIALPDLLFKH